MSNEITAILLGVAGTVFLHIGKCMQKQGIEILSVIKAKISGNSGKYEEVGSKNYQKAIIYIIGLILNNSIVFLIIISNIYAPASYFTSMFGVGLISLIVYSRIVLKEPVKIIEYIGTALLVFGTCFLGYEGINRSNLNMGNINVQSVFIIVAILFTITILLMVLSYKSARPFFIGLTFGLFTGSGACLDPIFKGIGQNIGGVPGLFPTTPGGWRMFLISFCFATASFLVGQWGFLKKANASVLVPVYSSVYIVLPIIIQSIALPGFMITGITSIGLILVVIGITMMQGFKDRVVLDSY